MNPARLVHSDSRNQTDIFLKFASRSQIFSVSNMKEELRQLWNQSSKPQAERFLESWCSRAKVERDQNVTTICQDNAQVSHRVIELV
jgi:hypothetical protein